MVFLRSRRKEKKRLRRAVVRSNARKAVPVNHTQQQGWRRKTDPLRGDGRRLRQGNNMDSVTRPPDAADCEYRWPPAAAGGSYGPEDWVRRFVTSDADCVKIRFEWRSALRSFPAVTAARGRQRGLGLVMVSVQR